MPIKNAIVVMFDSLQFNYLGCYGNEWIKTPNFDRFAAEGVLFENAYIEGLPTVPCRRAMYTGRYTLPKAGWVPLSMDDTTIADLCWGRPIDTALVFDSAPQRLPKFGYTRGFDKVCFNHGHEIDHDYYAQDKLYHLKQEDYFEDQHLNVLRAYGGEAAVLPYLHETGCYLKQRQYWRSDADQFVAQTLKKGVEYLEQVDRNKSFFLWVDSFDPHEPWDPPSVYDPELKCMYDPDYRGKDLLVPMAGLVEGVYTEEELHHIRMLYAEKVTLCDKWLGFFMDAVRRLGFEENTLMMVVSDHGEPMGNGEHGHGLMRKARPWPYEELAHAPMMLRGPGFPAGKRIGAFVQSVDVAPTVCDWLGIGVHPDMQGKSLLALARGEVDKVRDFAVAGYYNFSWAIYTENWSYVHWLRSAEEEASGAAELYNIDDSGRPGGACVKGKFGASEIGAAGTRVGGGSAVLGQGNEDAPDAYERLKDAASLDGSGQWTCTPASVGELPARDELYDRRVDPFQLNNVIDKYPDEARELLDTLKAFMAELRAS